MQRILTLIWFASIAVTCYLSLRPLPDQLFPVNHIDKLYHALTYCWLGFLPWLANEKADATRKALYMITLGILLEIGQSQVPGRSFSVGDMLANTAGVFLGISIGKRWLARKRTS